MSESISIVRYEAPDDDASFVEFVRAHRDADARRWVVHLQPRAFLGSAALGALIGWHQQLHEEDGRLVMVQPGRGVLRVVRMLGLEGLLRVFETEEEALASFEAPAEDASRIDAA